MSSADLATVIIACPNCGTRYQVPYGAVGASGRDVQCAQCGKSWHATADAPPPAPVPASPAPAPADDRLFSPDDEAALDRALEAVAADAEPPAPGQAAGLDPEHQRTLDAIRAAIAPKPRPQPVNALDPALLNKAKRAFAKRQKGIADRLPIARLRRTARLGVLVALISILVLGFSLREDLVTWFPQLAGLYSSLGVPVNVIGLQFEDPKTLTLLRDGKTVMQISAKIRSIATHTVPLPPVLVSLLDAKGGTIYQWSVAPQASNMDPGDLINFQTEMNAPPDSAVSVQLSFTSPGSAVGAPIAQTKVP
jgi:predicted Zn finger-like uncharacterized protein